MSDSLQDANDRRVAQEQRLGARLGVQGPAYGVALLAGVGTGVWNNVEEACRACIKQTAKIMPNKKRAAIYDRHYSTYRKLYGDLKDRFSEMAALACG